MSFRQVRGKDSGTDRKGYGRGRRGSFFYNDRHVFKPSAEKDSGLHSSTRHFSSEINGTPVTVVKPIAPKPWPKLKAVSGLIEEDVGAQIARIYEEATDKPSYALLITEAGNHLYKLWHRASTDALQIMEVNLSRLPEIASLRDSFQYGVEEASQVKALEDAIGVCRMYKAMNEALRDPDANCDIFVDDTTGDYRLVSSPGQ